ncbi:MAG: DNA-binding transcriptional regulator Fis [Acidiferrobacteraceae bacterium]|jgi:Fis family transcriptional regulator|nr:DNA-binding transcriptional regulator Fis [Acidiferrobacteraceae bacterium]|tara:strand:- start:5904 stop:6152 length:249 start_codon:yes stop_codon:yes gene_type:complete
MKKKNTNNLLSDAVENSLAHYFDQLNGEEATGIYEMVIKETERPLLKITMEQAFGNQTRAAKMLGINRNTLKKKLASYGLDK